MAGEAERALLARRQAAEAAAQARKAEEERRLEARQQELVAEIGALARRAIQRLAVDGWPGGKLLPITVNRSFGRQKQKEVAAWELCSVPNPSYRGWDDRNSEYITYYLHSNGAVAIGGTPVDISERTVNELMSIRDALAGMCGEHREGKRNLRSPCRTENEITAQCFS